MLFGQCEDHRHLTPPALRLAPDKFPFNCVILPATWYKILFWIQLNLQPIGCVSAIGQRNMIACFLSDHLYQQFNCTVTTSAAQFFHLGRTQSNRIPTAFEFSRNFKNFCLHYRLSEWINSLSVSSSILSQIFTVALIVSFYFAGSCLTTEQWSCLFITTRNEESICREFLLAL